MKYNDLTVPPIIRVDRIISAFENGIDYSKVETYTEVMRTEGLCHEFPPIKGHPTIIDEDDIGDFFMTMEEITEEHIGHFAWKVTDGHHRTLAAIEANLPHLEVSLDYNCITQEEDFLQYK